MITRLTTGEVVSYSGHHFSLSEAMLRLLPRRAATPADLDRRLGAAAHAPTRGTLRVMPRHAYGSPEELTELSARLDHLAREAREGPSRDRQGFVSLVVRAGPRSASQHREVGADAGFQLPRGMWLAGRGPRPCGSIRSHSHG